MSRSSLDSDASPLLGELLALSRRTNSWDRATPTLPSTLRAVSPADAQIERTASALDDDWRESRAE